MEDALKERKEQVEEANSEIECMERELRRLRISQLRRMAFVADSLRFDGPIMHAFQIRRLGRFYEACIKEIAGLRGDG